MTEPRRIILGVTGGIAAYKSADLVRRLRREGADVQVVMTRGACRFVTPLTFQALTHHPVRTELFDPAAEAGMGHLELARWADDVVIAPASADLMARLAGGLADDLLTTLCLATEAPLTLAPAMNWAMWRHPATRANADTLRSRGVRLLGPAVGELAEGESGEGRMLEPGDITSQLLGPGPLSGSHWMVTAGPTREPMDPVRYLSNRSSGRMGFAVAGAAARAGARVTLVTGPVTLGTPPGCERVDVETAEEMRGAVMERATDCDVFVAVAAVADYRVADVAPEKIRKSRDAMSVSLKRNPDILAEVAALGDGPFTVGFAAETENVEQSARAKLQAKRLDMIAANRVGDGFGFDVDDNSLTVLWEGGRHDLPRAGKQALADALVALIRDRLIDAHRFSPGAQNNR
jgi:phosphopantothenoylcysteine decarboxylase/phosphopantothenate--cysteine ligase